jgi:hypothetical protein
MPYTLWSKDRLVGHTDLGFVESTPGVRFGWFHPTETGAPIVEVITAPSRVLLRATQRGDRTSCDAELEIASANVDALALQLRDENGSVVKTDDVGVIDTEVTLQYRSLTRTEDLDDDDGSTVDALFTDALDDFELLEFEVETDDEELEPLPRYQIIVFLEGHHALMSREALSIGGDDG